MRQRVASAECEISPSHSLRRVREFGTLRHVQVNKMNNTVYCDLREFAETYKYLHGYLSLFVCVFGSVANVLNICVLTTRDMRGPTNFILTGLAVADLLVMVEYIPFSIHRYVQIHTRFYIEHYSYDWALFLIFHALFTQIFHFISCCLTVILAIWRYIAISHPQNNSQLCNPHRTKMTIFLTFVLCPIICLPMFLSLNVKAVPHECDSYGKFVQKNYTGVKFNRTIYLVNNEGEQYRYVSFLMYGVVIKLVPCILLTLLSWRLIRALLETKKRRRNLLNTSLPMEMFQDNGGGKKGRKIDKERQTDRTTRMLLAVLLLFLVTEFPQAILGLLHVIIGEKFEEQCYRPLGDLLDFVALTNSAINFILYCTMSRQFREAFQKFFKPKLLNRWLPVAQNSPMKDRTETQMTLV